MALSRCNTSANTDACPICLDPLKPDDDELQILACGHLYHKSCLVRNEDYQWDYMVQHNQLVK